MGKADVRAARVTVDEHRDNRNGGVEGVASRLRCNRKADRRLPLRQVFLLKRGIRHRTDAGGCWVQGGLQTERHAS